MAPSKFVETARRIIRENPGAFEALLEYERTKKLPKITYRERANFTLDSVLLRKFRSHCTQKNLNMSRVIEKHIKEELGLK